MYPHLPKQSLSAGTLAGQIPVASQLILTNSNKYQFKGKRILDIQ